MSLNLPDLAGVVLFAMTTLIAFIWLLILVGLGGFCGRPRTLSSGYLLLRAWVLGSVVTGVSFLALSQLGQFDLLSIMIVTAILTLLSVFGWRQLLSSLDHSPWVLGKHFWRSLDEWDRRWALIIGAVLVVLWLDAATPPRTADAMRYHLAQMEDMVRNHGFVYRPYYHYNFPIYYAYLTTPLYFIVGGAGVKLFNFFVVMVVAAITYGIGRAAGVRRSLVPVLGVLLTPGIVQAATTVGNDLAILAFALSGILLLHGAIKTHDRSLILVAYASIGFAIGAKYQSMLFLPWYLWLTWVALERKLDWSRIRQLVLPGLVAALLPAPFFIQNYLNTGDPIWPLQLDLFGVQQDFVYEMADRYSSAMTGHHGVSTMWAAFMQLMTTGAMIPTVPIFAFLGVVGLLWKKRDETHLYLAFGVLSLILLWWIIQPSLFPRYWNYLIPQFMVLSLIAFEWMKNFWLRRLTLLAAAVSIGFGIVVLGVYSISFFEYHLDGDLDAYHDYTWFYDEYAWMNENLPDDARVLVVVLSGHTYYMPRDYLRADPLYSGLLDWRELDAQSLYETMEELDLDYLFYQDRDWGDAVAGQEMMETMAEFVVRDDVHVIWERDILLGTSRMRNQAEETQVWLLERVDPEDRVNPLRP